IIDITADQFKEYNRPKVYVGEKDAFYSLFSIVSSKSYDESFELGDLNDELPWYYMHITVRSKNNS
ncbi:MAG: hypothetical protein IJ418_10200, partial [Clostridia bacterium]|nr:hypothetical protein [Clostridia bacterium]